MTELKYDWAETTERPRGGGSWWLTCLSLSFTAFAVTLLLASL